MQQRADVLFRDAPILAFAPFNLFVVDGSAKSLKRVGETERISPEIFIDVSFNQDKAMRIIRFRQDTQCGKAWPEPMHLRSRKSPLHEQCYKPTVLAMPERRRLNVNRATPVGLIGLHCDGGHGTSGMLALVYMFTIWCVATVLYVIVNELEPNRRLATVLQFLILAVGAAAIVRRLIH
jgi:hypothetical protein